MSQPPTSQSWDAGRYARNARFVAELALPAVELLAPRPGERILDLGCGDGALTEQLAALGCEVVGVDSGPAMVEAARARGLDARLVDGQRCASRPSSMWCSPTPHCTGCATRTRSSPPGSATVDLPRTLRMTRFRHLHRPERLLQEWSAATILPAAL